MNRLNRSLIFVGALLCQAASSYATISKESQLRILRYAIEVGSDDVAKMVIGSGSLNLSKNQQLNKALIAHATKFGRHDVLKHLEVRTSDVKSN